MAEAVTLRFHPNFIAWWMCLCGLTFFGNDPKTNARARRKWYSHQRRCQKCLEWPGIVGARTNWDQPNV